MHVARAADSYRRTQVQSSAPLELVVLLYDGALRFMSAAREAILRRDIAARRDAISRSLAIVSELQSTLDMERGGDLAEQLDRLYLYVTGRLMDATTKNDVRAIDDARKVMQMLHDAWREIAAPAVVGAHP